MLDAPVLKIVLIGAWFALLALGERLSPAAPRPECSDAPRLTRNLGLWGGNILINPLIVVPLTLAATSFQLWSRPALGFWPELAIDLLLMDLWIYWWHRLNHQWPLLWRFHGVHHLDRFLDSTSAVRFHPGEVALSALARMPIIVLADISLTSIIVFDALVLLSALFHHSNLRLPAAAERALRMLIVTPSHHWVHHHRPRSDTDSNYATLLTLWDRLFGTWSRTARWPQMPIGAGEEADSALPRLVVRPFRRHPPGRG